MESDNSYSRRDLLKQVGIGSLAAVVGRLDNVDIPERSPASSAATMIGVPFEKRDVVRIAIVGTGLRGRSMLDEWLAVDGVRITALCDVIPEKVALAVQQMRKAGHEYEPALFTSGERAFEALCARNDIDLVYTATPWEWHVPVCLTAMQHGKHVATEVPAAYTVEDCWKLVDASEKSRRHCLMLEKLLLRLQRAARPEHVSRERTGRAQARRRRVQPRPARDPFREQRRRTVAPGAAHQA